MGKVNVPVTAHARERMEERHGEDLSDDEWLRIAHAIRDRSGAILTRKLPNGQEEWRVPIGGAAVGLVWDPTQRKIITTLGGKTFSRFLRDRALGKR